MIGRSVDQFHFFVSVFHRFPPRFGMNPFAASLAAFVFTRALMTMCMVWCTIIKHCVIQVHKINTRQV